ncbi:hypothetical protein [Zhihengliuella sp.]|uniref:hypothetical protein n=1 Tax=Zhihengliuella sp. TaxID=1954483 RepID=UPI0028126FB0|nr:hypothetical protein [Zhihengliuella sp.]
MHKSKDLVHGIDITAPGGIAKLLAFHHKTFGDAVMQEGAGTGGDGGNAGGTGAGGTPPAGGQQPPAGGAGGQQPPAAGAGDGAPPAGGDGDGDEALNEPGKKALIAERQAKKQLQQDLAARDARIKQLEDAGKTDEQRREQELENLRSSDKQKDATISEQARTLLAYRVAAKKGLDLEAAERLRGDTEEALGADADEWIRKWGSSKGNGVVPGAGAGDAGQVNVQPGLSRIRTAYETKK